MLITLLYSKIDQLYERYREIQLTPSINKNQAARLIDDSLYFATELVEIIEQLKTDELKNNQ